MEFEYFEYYYLSPDIVILQVLSTNSYHSTFRLLFLAV